MNFTPGGCFSCSGQLLFEPEIVNVGQVGIGPRKRQDPSRVYRQGYLPGLEKQVFAHKAVRLHRRPPREKCASQKNGQKDENYRPVHPCISGGWHGVIHTCRIPLRWIPFKPGLVRPIDLRISQ